MTNLFPFRRDFELGGNEEQTGVVVRIREGEHETRNEHRYLDMPTGKDMG